MDKKSGLEELNKRREISLLMGGKDRVERHHQRGYLTARERIEKLLDPGTFTETGLFEQYDIPGSGGDKLPTSRIVGHGKIEGRRVVIHADDRTVFAGSDAQKISGLPLRGPNLGGDKGLGYPIVILGDGGGGV